MSFPILPCISRFFENTISFIKFIIIIFIIEEIKTFSLYTKMKTVMIIADSPTNRHFRFSISFCNNINNATHRFRAVQYGICAFNDFNFFNSILRYTFRRTVIHDIDWCTIDKH